MSFEPLAFVTMVRGDHHMMRKWVSHYGALVGSRRALHVFLHGEDPELARIVDGCSVTVLPFDPAGAGFEDSRRELFFGMVRALKGYYRHVVTVDSDEFIVLDPKLGMTLADYLGQTEIPGSALSPLGFDVVHRTVDEPGHADMGRGILSQRSFGFADGSYSKPCIFRKMPLRGNQHHISGEDWVIDPNILLFHLRFFDRSFGEALARTRIAQIRAFDKEGGKHSIGTWRDRMARLNRAIDLVNNGEPRELTAEESAAFCTRQIANYLERGRRLMWRDARHGPYRIPERFRETL